MTPHRPVVVVEDVWSTAEGAQALLSRELGHDVKLASSFDEMVAIVNALDDDPPVIVLDPGIPGICRLETVRRTARQLPRARVIYWSAVEQQASYCGALIDGAFAAVPKRRPMHSLLRVIERVSSGGRWCEPQQAQWFLDFLVLMDLHKAGVESGTWKQVEVESLPDLTEFRHRFEELAAGAPMPENDGWFVESLNLIRPRWLPPRLRRAQMALALHGGKRSAAAEAMGIARHSIDGYASDLSGRLMPERYTTGDKAERRDHAIVRALSDVHFPCELHLSEHDLDPEAFS